MSSDRKGPGNWHKPTGSPQKDADWTQPPDYVPAVDEEDIPSYQDEPEPATTPRELLNSFSQYIALFIFPLLFAGLTSLFVLPRVANRRQHYPQRVSGQ